MAHDVALQLSAEQLRDRRLVTRQVSRPETVRLQESTYEVPINIAMVAMKHSPLFITTAVDAQRPAPGVGKATILMHANQFSELPKQRDHNRRLSRHYACAVGVHQIAKTCSHGQQTLTASGSLGSSFGDDAAPPSAAAACRSCDPL